MSHHIYDTYYIDMPIENIFDSLTDNTFLTNITDSQEQTNQSNTNLSTNPTPTTPSLNNS